MQWFAEDELLITIGDHGWDILARPAAAAQLDDWDYGKIRVLNVKTGEFRPFAKGVRNPQGLLITPEGRIWAAEHGPRGGDELNLIVEGANYGWPYATYGTNYGEFNWGPAEMDPAKGARTYTLPRYSWVPSWGISSLIQIQADRFPSWTGDLLVASLAKATLFRLHLDDDRTVTTLRPSAAGRTELAIMECARCHTLRTGDVPLLTAPSLAGIMNRPVASDRSYPYSQALRSLGGRWTRERLSEFLANPQAYAPGTAMPFFGFVDEEELDSLTAYLGRL
jgi:cytochrome c2